MQALISYLFLINAVALLLMRRDKQCAIQKRPRIPERHFFLIAGLGGSAGIWAGMYLFCHKTRHRKFSIGIPFLLFFQLFLLMNLIKADII